jgi:hypothetical protein
MEGKRMRTIKAESQNWRMLRELKKHSMTNSDFVDMNIFKYTSRISELREYLRNNGGGDIIAHNQGGGLFRYFLKSGVQA